MVESKAPLLRGPILDYIRKNNGKVDSIDIWIHFKLSPDITLGEVNALTDEGKLRRFARGNCYVYEVF